MSPSGTPRYSVIRLASAWFAVPLKILRSFIGMECGYGIQWISEARVATPDSTTAYAFDSLECTHPLVIRISISWTPSFLHFGFDDRGSSSGVLMLSASHRLQDAQCLDPLALPLSGHRDSRSGNTRLGHCWPSTARGPTTERRAGKRRCSG